MKCHHAHLPNYGVLEVDLEQEEKDHLWKMVHKYAPDDSEWEGNRLISIKDINAKQWSLNDDDQVFANKVLMPLTREYMGTYGCPFKVKSTHEHGLAFNRFWCRASQRGDYQSIHDHLSVFTFVVWLKIPFDGKEEAEAQAGFRPEASDFVLVYPDTCGQLMKKHYRLNPHMDGMMIFFPSDMNHLVYPHFTTDEWRISIAGDIALNSNDVTTQVNHEFPDPKSENV